MVTRTCPNCNRVIGRQAQKCPHCGEATPSSGAKVIAIIGLAAVMLIVVCTTIVATS